jgi:hypothetical protein
MKNKGIQRRWIVAKDRQSWKGVLEEAEACCGLLLLLLLLLLVVMMVIPGVRFVAFTLLSQFYAFRHVVIIKRFELKITVLRWSSVTEFIPSFFCKTVNGIRNIQDTLKRTDKMVISYAYIFHYGRTEMQAFITDVVDMVVTEI